MKKICIIKEWNTYPPGAVLGLQDADADELVNKGFAIPAPQTARLVFGPAPDGEMATASDVGNSFVESCFGPDESAKVSHQKSK